jgi:HlyD family secretion protein
VPRTSRLLAIIVAVFLAAAVGVAYQYADAVKGWALSRGAPPTILVSGNIEAHESVLGFKTVQSRIVELPFDEGKWVKADTVIARLDDSDYRQQVAINEAALDVQRRQLATSEQNQAAAQKIVESDEADLEYKKTDFERAEDLMRKGAGTVQARDLASSVLNQSNALHARDQVP